MRESLTTPDGEVLEPMGWTGKHRSLARLVRTGSAVAVWPDEQDDVEWIEDPLRWWSDHASRVLTVDHRPDESGPSDRAYFPSVWRGRHRTVLLLEEALGPGD
jgi:hypothetical protein